MTIEEAYRQLGVAIQEEEHFVAYQKAQNAASEDPQVKAITEQLGEIMSRYEAEAIKPTPDDALIEQIQKDYEEQYQKLYQTDTMVALLDAKEALDPIMNEIMNYIYLVTGGEDPLTVKVTAETIQAMQQQMMSM